MATEGGDAGGGTILVVEDQDAVRAVVAQMLEDAGYRVLSSTGAEQALALFRERSSEIDLVVSDVVMPEMSGDELIEQMRTMRPSLRVLYMSGYLGPALDRFREGLAGEGADLLEGAFGPGTMLLRKPFPSSALLRAVEELLGKPR